MTIDENDFVCKNCKKLNHLIFESIDFVNSDETIRTGNGVNGELNIYAPECEFILKNFPDSFIMPFTELFNGHNKEWTFKLLAFLAIKGKNKGKSSDYSQYAQDLGTIGDYTNRIREKRTKK